MAHIVIMPRQGNTVESCVIVDWHKKEGDPVQADTPICDVETDKATFEVVAGAEGILLKILHETGDDVPVLQPIAVIGKADEDWQAILAKAGGVTAGTSQAGATADAPAVSPRARNLAAREALDLNAVAGTGPGGRIIERDVQAVLEGRPPMTAAARAAMAGTGVAAAIPGEPSGIGGRIRVSDLGNGSAVQGQTGVEASAGMPAGQSTVGASAGSLSGTKERTETPIKGIRKLISDRMLESLASTAQFTLNSHARSDRLLDLRQRFKASHPDLGLQTITVTDIILFALSRLLPLYPFMNAHKLEDKLITYKAVHLGIAVDTPRGLMVPVIRNADQLSLAQISAEAKRLAAACQQGNINPDELTGSTFTVTNLGALGIESFTPVINIPEVAILGVCGMELKPLAKEGSVTGIVDATDVQFVPHIGLSLTINHQVVDGAPAARFLRALCDEISQIDLWLAR